MPGGVASSGGGGLHVRSPSTGEWASPEADVPAGWGLVIAGETLSTLTRGRIPASVHRVWRPGPGERRVSLPYLCRGRPDAVIRRTWAGADEAADEAAAAASADEAADEGESDLSDLTLAQVQAFIELRRRKETHMRLRAAAEVEGEAGWVLS